MTSRNPGVGHAGAQIRTSAQGHELPPSTGNLQPAWREEPIAVRQSPGLGDWLNGLRQPWGYFYGLFGQGQWRKETINRPVEMTRPDWLDDTKPSAGVDRLNNSEMAS
ncbi:hypothetical protein Bbelb_163210 [Branchiostoma belcheri]|nr:hypothetical protein Bbelb_163210 [Branchiostoma belcheri]